MVRPGGVAGVACRRSPSGGVLAGWPGATKAQVVARASVGWIGSVPRRHSYRPGRLAYLRCYWRRTKSAAGSGGNRRRRRLGADCGVRADRAGRGQRRRRSRPCRTGRQYDGPTWPASMAYPSAGRGERGSWTGAECRGGIPAVAGKIASRSPTLQLSARPLPRRKGGRQRQLR